MKAALVVGVLAFTAHAAYAQSGRIVSTATETVKVTQPLEREIGSLGERKRNLWVAYRLQTAHGTHPRCNGSHVLLEPSPGVTIMAKLEAGALRRLQVFTAECDVDAGSTPLIWLEGVTADASAAWMTALVRSTPPSDEWRQRVATPAINALGFHPGETAIRSLIALARDDARANVRSAALVSLAERAGQQSAAAITAAVSQDPELEVRKQAVVALSRLPKGEGVPLLVQVAKTNKDLEIRRQAMFWLGRSNDPRAVAFFEEVLAR